ncbi:MAG: hypothetical protein KBD12_00355 [Candidatus Pacebacteria bacterium]|nr:hypothetical protein [Candidatus Paceibacterota bacterium]
MLYFIFGTNVKKREFAKKEIKFLLKEEQIDFDTLLKVENISLENISILPSYFESVSLFGEKILIQLDDLLFKEESREFLYKNIKSILESDNVFILNEAFALPPSVLKIEKILEKENLLKNIFNCKEDILKKDIEPFYFCDLIEKRDKKGAWKEFQNIYLEWEDAEAQALHGAVWWKWKMIWSAYLDGDKNNYYRFYKLKEKDIKYTKEEIEKFGFELSLMAMKANSGEINLMRSIEKFILEL